MLPCNNLEISFLLQQLSTVWKSGQNLNNWFQNTGYLTPSGHPNLGPTQAFLVQACLL